MGSEMCIRDSTHKDFYVTIRDAFNVAERQLKAALKKHRIIHNKVGRGIKAS